jgi:hypothetical protein
MKEDGRIRCLSDLELPQSIGGVGRTYETQRAPATMPDGRCLMLNMRLVSYVSWLTPSHSGGGGVEISQWYSFSQQPSPRLPMWC